MKQNDPAEAEAVSVIRLDQYAETAGLDKIHLIKIDTEGYEWEVIKGGGGLLAPTGSWRPTLICEIMPRSFSVMGTSLREFSDFMKRLRYVSLRVSDEQEPIEITDLLRLDDVIFLPEERAALVTTAR